MNLTSQESSLLFDKDVKGASPCYSPDGSLIAFTYKEKENSTQVWSIPAAGGEKLQLTHAKNDVKYFRWQADGQMLPASVAQPTSVRKSFWCIAANHWKTNDK